MRCSSCRVVADCSPGRAADSRQVSSVGVNLLASPAVALAAAWFAAISLLPAQQSALRLVDRPAPPAAAETAPWPTDHAAAVAAAKQRHKLLLLFFTAKW